MIASNNIIVALPPPFCPSVCLQPPHLILGGCITVILAMHEGLPHLALRQSRVKITLHCLHFLPWTSHTRQIPLGVAWFSASIILHSYTYTCRQDFCSLPAHMQASPPHAVATARSGPHAQSCSFHCPNLHFLTLKYIYCATSFQFQ